MQLSERGPRLIAIFLALIAAACVKPPNPGVTIQDVRSDVSFGAAPPNAAAPVTQTATTPVDPAAFSFDNTRLRRLPGATRVAVSCPEAPVSASAQEDAGIDAKGTPKEGVYRWRREGNVEIRVPYPIKLPVGGFENRVIQNVRKINADDFTYELAQSEVYTNDIVVTTFQVRPHASSERVGFTDRRVGETDRGLAIVKFERFDSNTGQLRETAEFEPAVLILPLPVLAGEQFQGVGFAPQRGSLQVEGRVVERRRVDACGELIDGWFVDASRTFSDPQRPGTPQDWNFTVATQLGAMLIHEKVVYSDAQQAFDVDFTIGQINPSPKRGEDR